ncbi:MAG: tetratricopeptide repeat protein [Thermoguttaceae bacterium]|nr:tetratricopeptide repeat protein [Thermoguttaceae bacterium]
MPYNYDYFISYAHIDNQSEDGKPGFIDEFVEKLKNSTEHQQMFGEKVNVFFDKTEIHSMSDWDNRIRASLAESRFLIVLLSPSYFQSEYCAREFDWWMQHEMHRCVLGEGTAPILIVDVAMIYDYQAETIPSIPRELQTRFPNWLRQIRKIQSGPKFDIHNLDRAKISDVLKTLREEVKDRVRRQEAAEKSPHTGQYPAYNENFVGRRENLRSLRKSLSEKSEAPYCALTGLGGFGKTELALTYGHAFAWDYELGRVFAKCENKTSISEAILTSGIAEMHGWELPNGSEDQQITFLFNRLNVKRKEIVKRNAEEGNLNTLGAHILLILDNVNKRKLISKNNLAILPDYFHVIITTRENTNDISYIHTESVERLSEDESVELLCNLHPFANPDEAKAARDIAKLLAGFTLSVELTGSYLENNKYITYKKQYDRLVSNHAETFQKMADKTGDLTRHAAETVAAVLESTLSALPDNARKALEFASIMSPDTVALGWLPELCGLDEEEGEEAIAYLTGYSLLTPLESEPNIARMHRLVAETVKQKIPENVLKEIFSKIQKKCYSLLEKDKTFWFAAENFWNIMPVSEFCLTLAEQWTLEPSEKEINWDVTEMLEKSGKTLKSLGKIDDALSVFKKLMKISSERASVFSSDAVLRDLALAFSDLGEMDYMTGKIDAAKECHTQALAIRKSLADSHPDNVEIQCDLADSYKFLGEIENDKGNYNEVKKFYLEILNISKNDNISQDIRAQKYLSTSYGRLGDVENSIGNATAAREWYEKAMELRKKLFEAMPEDVVNQQNLSSSYRRLGDLEKDAGNVTAARKWFEKAMELRKRLAETQPKNVLIQRGLSVLYIRLGDLEKDSGNLEGERNWYVKAMEIFKRLADYMPDNVEAQRNLSTAYSRLGDLENIAGNADAALAWYEKTMEIFKRLANSMPENIEAQKNLSASYRRLGNIERAAGNAVSALDWYKKMQEIDQRLADMIPNDINALRELNISYNQLGDLESAAGNADAALEWYEKALEIAQRLAELTPDNIEVQRDLNISYNRFGDLENAVGNADAALEWYEKALKIAQRLAELTPDNIEVQKDLNISYNRLGDFEKAAGNVDAAREWYKKGMEILKRLANILPDNIEIKRDLCTLYNQLGYLEDAAGNEDAALEWRKKEKEIHQSLTDNIPD